MSQTFAPGSLQNPIVSERTALNCFSVRNNTIVQYYNNSETNENRKGHKASLVQNIETDYKENYKNLKSVDYFTDVNQHTKKIMHQYELHKNEFDKIGVAKLKPLGLMSVNQVKSVRRCLENVVSLVLINYKKSVDITNQKYLTFVTLTLPSKQVHSDKLLRKCQSRFIENLQKTYQVQHYIWRAETQSNGNIHFHLLIDRFVNHSDVRRLWNSQIETLGYISRYAEKRKKEGFIYKPYYFKKGKRFNSKLTKQEQKNNYLQELKEGFKSPNSTDIHSLKNVKNSVSYIMKYLTKLEPCKRPVIGALWGAGNLTKKLQYPKFYETDANFNRLKHLLKSGHKDIKCVLKDDYFSVYAGKVYQVLKTSYNSVWHSIKNHYKTCLSLTAENIDIFDKSLKMKPILKTINENILKTKEYFAKLNAPVKPVKTVILKPTKKYQFDIFGSLSPLLKFKLSSPGAPKLTSYKSYKKYVILNDLPTPAKILNKVIQPE